MKKKTNNTAYARVLESRQRKVDAGLVRKEMWTHPHDWEAVQFYAGSLAIRRKKREAAK